MNIQSLINNFFPNKDSGPLCKTAVSMEPSLEKAIEEISNELRNFQDCDIALVFISTQFSSDFPRLLPLVKKKIKANTWIGCAGNGVIGSNINGFFPDKKNIPSISITLLRLPGTKVIPFEIKEGLNFDLDKPSTIWKDCIKNESFEDSSVIMFFDPSEKFTDDLISSFDFSFPNSNLIGAVASYHSSSHGSLFYQNKVCKGSIGVVIKGEWKIETLVTKGVKPIGPVVEVESVNRNILLKLRDINNKLASPIEFLQRIIGDLSEKEKNLLKQSLYLGIENKNMKIGSDGKLLSDGTFVVRDVLGIDPINGSVAVAELLKVGQKIQFQSRDIAISQYEIEKGLENMKSLFPEKLLLTLLFSCSAISDSFYDNETEYSYYSSFFKCSKPLSGLFCQGEIGQIKGNTNLHGYSACWGFLVKKS